jgi:hypothetical protein
MKDEDLGELMRREEAKRDSHWAPVERWRVIQEMITWAEQQATVRRNTPARCLELQAKKLAFMSSPSRTGKTGVPNSGKDE